MLRLSEWLLNETYAKGGAKFEVENYGICDIEKGDCLEFDSRLYHRFSPITEGIRYSLAVWLLGKSWSG